MPPSHAVAIDVGDPTFALQPPHRGLCDCSPRRAGSALLCLFVLFATACVCWGPSGIQHLADPLASHRVASSVGHRAQSGPLLRPVPRPPSATRLDAAPPPSISAFEDIEVRHRRAGTQPGATPGLGVAAIACCAMAGAAVASSAMAASDGPAEPAAAPAEEDGEARRGKKLMRKRKRGNIVKIQWYPHHIARAERELTRQLKLVDVVLEVRDARIPLATSHPRLEKWTAKKQRLLLINRADQIPPYARQEWDEYFRSIGETPFWINGRSGDGIKPVLRVASECHFAANAARARRGLRPRAARALVLGFPNVGKSAIINRMAGRKVADSAPRPGVTVDLRWLRFGPHLEMLDSPGMVPPRLNDEAAATLLSCCDDIGQAAYDNETIAVQLIEILMNLPDNWGKEPPRETLRRRYGVPINMAPWDFLEAASWRHTSGLLGPMACRVLNDFRRGLLGDVCLQLPPRHPDAPPAQWQPETAEWEPAPDDEAPLSPAAP
eukprot:EG_transcript_8629